MNKIPRTRTEMFVAMLTEEQKIELAVLIAHVRRLAATSSNASIEGCANGFMNALDRATREV